MRYLKFILPAFVLALFLNPIFANADGKGKASKEYFHSINLTYGVRGNAERSLDWVVERGNKDMAAHLITAMRYSPIGREKIGEALEEITGEDFGGSWFDWMLWQEKNPQIKSHESYTHYKSVAFYGIDPSFSRFFRPEMEYDIRPEEIVWGGVPVDGIPALDNPKHIPASEASYLEDDDEVFALEINGDARAYPLRIMGWHEMFNDVVGGVPVSLAYCTLCNSGILFEGDYKGSKKFGVNKPFTFGSSGFLYRSNKLMYDRNTDSLWNQFTGKPVSGKLRGSGIELKIRPVVITSWGEWKKQNPDTKVLHINTGFRRNYGSGVVYNDYFASDELMFPALGDQSRKLSEKDEVFGLRLFGGTKAWKLDNFKGGKVINDQVGQINVVLIGDSKTRTVRAYEREQFEFSKGLQSNDGTQWTLEEEHLISAEGKKLKRLPGHVAYWFAWAGYLGDETELQ